MCGFCGFVDSGAGALPDPVSVVRRMADRLAHRGPDDAGTWVDPSAGVVFGHRRLAVVDLSAEGHQPMHSACGRYVISYNGEIYNHRQLRAALDEEPGEQRWRGHSDTEVMLAAISRWGLKAALQRFNGMFAFALWDRQERLLHLARDRLGEKPLYYGWVGGWFLFGSELKALRAHPAWRGEIDRDAITLLLRHNYIPAPYCIYHGFRKLPPAGLLSLPVKGRTAPADARLASYWSPRAVAEHGLANRFAGSDQEAVEQLDELLRDAVALRMEADVPLGAFLSGGVDSSAVVALMQAQSGQPVRTFSIGFDEQGYDEAPHAAAVARHLGTRHTELYLTPAEAMSVIPELPGMYDEPFSDSSQIPTYLVSRLARQHVTVSLSGDGGDELFGGYNRYFWGRRIWRKVGWLPTPVRQAAARGLHAVSPVRWDGLFHRFAPLLRGLRYSSPGDKLHKLAEVLAADSPEAMYRGLVSHWRSPEDLVADSREPATALSAPDQWPALPDFVERMMYLDMITYLPGDILTKVDRASMRVSLEARVPMLDHRVAEFAWRLPLAMKVRGNEGKWALRQVLYRYVPRELIERPKMGFGVPVDRWLRGPLRDWAESLLSEKRLREEGFFAPGPVREKWQEHLSGRRAWHYLIWDILMFQAWLENEAATLPRAGTTPLISSAPSQR